MRKNVSSFSRKPAKTRPEVKLKSGGARSSHGVVLLSRSAADADRAHDFAVTLQWDAAGENHYFAVIGRMDSKELPARLRMGRKILGCDIESAGGVGLLLCDVDTANPRAVHPD